MVFTYPLPIYLTRPTPTLPGLEGLQLSEILWNNSIFPDPDNVSKWLERGEKKSLAGKIKQAATISYWRDSFQNIVTLINSFSFVAARLTRTFCLLVFLRGNSNINRKSKTIIIAGGIPTSPWLSGEERRLRRDGSLRWSKRPRSKVFSKRATLAAWNFLFIEVGSFLKWEESAGEHLFVLLFLVGMVSPHFNTSEKERFTTLRAWISHLETIPRTEPHLLYGLTVTL